MPRGGKRQGTAGKAYGNRTDLQNAVNQAPAKIERRQPSMPAGPQGNAQAVLAQQQGPPPLTPDQVPSMFAPDANPDVPLTAGMPTGPGPGPEVLASRGASDPAVAELEAIYLQYPYEGIRRLLDAYRVR